MKAKKTFLSFLILFVFVFHAVNVSAYTLTANDGKTIINVQEITKDQFPEIVTPLEFESQEEADAFLKEAFAFEGTPALLPDNKSSDLMRDTFGDALVKSYSSIHCKFELRLSYGTSLSGNRGVVTFHNPYVRFTGLTFGSSYTQSNIGSQVTNSGKDIYAYFNGTINYKLSVVGGGEQVASSPISLSGIVPVIH